MSLNNKRILFMVSGSIAAFKAVAAVSKLAQHGFEVRVVLTGSTLKFIGASSFEGLLREPPLTDSFEPGFAMAHIDWVRWADLVLLYPATAHQLNALSAGLAADVVGTFALVRESNQPFWIAPAMNPTMWKHPATQLSVQALKSWGVRILDPGVGSTACGEIGEGRLIEPEALINEVNEFFKIPATTTSNDRILITGGGTRVPIDPIRYISNQSTGKTAYEIATLALTQGATVDLLLAKDSPYFEKALHLTQENHKLRLFGFLTFQDFETELFKRLETVSYTHCVHAAAVSDFAPDAAINKLDSGEIQQLTLKPLPKLIARIKERSKNPSITLFGFKLTTGQSMEEVQKLILKKYSFCDGVFWNDHESLKIAREKNSAQHPGLYYVGKQQPRSFESVGQWFHFAFSKAGVK